MLPKPFQVHLPVLTGILFIAFSLGLCAQNYSVNATVLLAPPYSSHLQDYAQPGNEQLKIILLERDLTQTNFQVRLSFSISLNGKVVMRTSPAFTPVPVELLPNLPTILSGADLADYFNPKNLIFTGIDRDLYLKTKALPEGDVQVCVTAYYFARPTVQVSNQGCSLYYLADNGPPMLSFPRDGDRVPFREPANIIFQWFPGAMGNPTLALNTEYVFELFENRVPGKDPNNVVLTQRPLLTAVSGATNYVYAPTDPALFEGLNYVWRVQVVDKEGKNSFKNNGYSVPYSFTYGGSGPTLFQVGKVQNFRAVAYNESLARLSWKKDTALFDGYRVSYMKEVSLAGWIDDKSPDSVYALSNLLPNTSYLARISGQKGGFYGEVSAIVRFITPSPRVFECKPEEQGLPKADVNNPKLDLVSGDIVNVDGQEMQILKIEHLGGGHYRGMGAMRVALLRNLRFRSVFQDLYIDNKNIVGYGRIDYVSKGVEAFENKQIAKQKTKEGIRDLANQLNGLDTASTSTMLVWAARVALLDESIINETLVLTGDEKQQLLGAKAAIAADVQKLKDNPTDVTAQKNLKKDFQALKAPLQKLSEYMGKGLWLALGLIKEKIVEEILQDFEKEIEVYLKIPESGRKSKTRGPAEDIEWFRLNLPVCLQDKSKEELKNLREFIGNELDEKDLKKREFTQKVIADNAPVFNTLYDRAVAYNKANKIDTNSIVYKQVINVKEGIESICKGLASEEVQKQIILDRIIACLSGAVVDVGLQYTFKWVELWMDDKPVPFTDYKQIFGSLDASQVAVSAGTACLAAVFPLIPTTKNKLIAAVLVGLGDGAYAMADDIYNQYDEIGKKEPEASIETILKKINWQSALVTGGANFLITSISTGVTLYAKGNPRFIGFAKKLEEKIQKQGTQFLEKAGLNKESIDALLKKLKIKGSVDNLLQLPQISAQIQNGSIKVSEHWRNLAVKFNLDDALRQKIINNTSGSIADDAEAAVIKQFTDNGFAKFLTKYGGNNGIDGLLANNADISKATKIIILEIKSSIEKKVPFQVTLGQGYNGYQLDSRWLNGVINKMTGRGEIDKTIQKVGNELRRIYDNSPDIFEKYVVEVDNLGQALILKIN